ncbi:MAG: ABC transporter substrate-binding protein [Candidatus Gracilibacteria bacterium]
MLFSGWQLLAGDWGRSITSVITGGHNYNEGMVGEIIRLNPVYTELNEVDQDITSLIFEGLTKYDPQQKKFVENMATHTLDDTQSIYTFTLKDGLTWHDGTPVTADDVYFTYHDVIQNPDFENPILKESFSGVTVEKIDEKTIKMTLKEVNSFFFTQLTVGILPQHLLADIPVSELDSNDFNQKPIGNGPYRVTDAYDRSTDGTTGVSLEYYENYWKNDSPEITEINFTAYPTYEDLIKNRGKLHGIARVPNYRIEEMKQDRFIQNAYALPQYTALFLQTDDEELVKEKIRIGIQKSIDKKAIVDAIGYDYIVDTPLLELSQEDWINQPNTEEAAGAFFEAGWPLDETRGVRINEDGDQILAFTLVRRSYSDLEQEKVAKTTADMIASQLEAIGVTVTVEAYDIAPFQEKVKNRDYDLLLYGQNLGYNLDTYSFWHSSQVGDGLNLSNYGNAKADFYIQAIRSTFDDESEQKTEYLRKLGEIINNDVPAVFLYRPTYYFLADERLQNIYTENLLFPQDRFSNILQWTVQP